MTLIYFSYPITLSKILNRLSYKCAKNGHPCLVSDLSGKALHFFP